MPIRVVSWDVGGVLGGADSTTSVTGALCDVTGTPREQVSRVVRERLHREHTISETVISAVATDLCVDPEVVRKIVFRRTELHLDPDVRAAVFTLHHQFPHVRHVITSNATATGAHHADLVLDTYGPVIDEAFFSWQTGLAKGVDWQCWDQITQRLRVDPSEIVHVGDRWREDIEAPLMAGCRALWVRGDQRAHRRPAGPGRFRTVRSALEAPHELHDWIMQADDERSALAVRGSVLLRDQHGRLLITIGPDDARRGKRWTLPGGRAPSYGNEDPAATAMREIREELDITTSLSSQDQKLVAWSENETSTGGNKIVFVYDAGFVDSDSLVVTRSEEIAAYRWASPDECHDLLDPPEKERLDAIDRGQAQLYQHVTSAERI